ncbi:SOS response-associated peptidase family protein [Bradyrhizobium sp. Arg62]|uniref:SOS response-associated peptidase family protein n=1 Tax=Bradyrhizobium TaxID=374 RepID=UPI001E49C4DF|nr:MULTISPECIES: SOS response-associated peptidase family protein [Bradyrhizobium]MCC8942831.1 SOS response-associated peptidase family protein [Bradyrhizobium ivorense]MCC8951556.1 SOS response-associated peptidase family protein [Bradyrhizobium brasilense]
MQSQCRADQIRGGAARRARQEGFSAPRALWGSICPPQAEKKRPPLLNARTDRLKRESFKSRLASGRCIIPAEAFMNGGEEDGAKQPYLFARKDGKPLLLEIGDITTEDGKNAAAVAMGGKARAERLSAKRRREIAKEAAEKRWGKQYLAR